MQNMKNDILETTIELVNQLENPFLSYGDFQQKAELVKRGLDILIKEKSAQIDIMSNEVKIQWFKEKQKMIL